MFSLEKHFVFARALDRRVKIERCQTPAIWCLLRATPNLFGSGRIKTAEVAPIRTPSAQNDESGGEVEER